MMMSFFSAYSGPMGNGDDMRQTGLARVEVGSVFTVKAIKVAGSGRMTKVRAFDDCEKGCNYHRWLF